MNDTVHINIAPPPLLDSTLQHCSHDKSSELEESSLYLTSLSLSPIVPETSHSLCKLKYCISDFPSVIRQYGQSREKQQQTIWGHNDLVDLEMCVSSLWVNTKVRESLQESLCDEQDSRIPQQLYSGSKTHRPKLC